MIFVYSEASKESLKSSLNIAQHHFNEVNEDFSYCIQRERAKEILTLRQMGLPYIVLAPAFTVRNGDGHSEILDTNVELTSLPEDLRLVMRADKGVILPPALIDRPQFLTPSQHLAVSQWPLHINEPDHFLKRNLYQLDHREFSQRLLSGDIETPIFIKGVEKGSAEFSLHYVFRNHDELTNMFMNVGDAKLKFPHLQDTALSGIEDNLVVAVHQSPSWYCEYRESMQPGRLTVFNPKDGLIVSDVLEIEKIGQVKAEFRAFIVNGKVTSLSAYVDYESVPVPEAIRVMSEDFSAANSHLAPAYVADFAMSDRGPVLIELNDLYQSGRYLDNDPACLFSALTEDVDLSVFNFIEPLPVPEDEILPFHFGVQNDGLNVGPVDSNKEPSKTINFNFLLEP